MTAIQRFGSALNLNVHFHTLAVQGVFVDDSAGGLRFVPNPAPSDAEVETLLLSIARRITRLVRRHGIELERPQEEDSTDPLAIESPLLAGISGASVLGRVATGGRAGQSVSRVDRRSASPLAAAVAERQTHFGGFDLHAGVAVPAGDRERLEHLCRYVLRPPVAQDALELTPDGRILLNMRRAWHDGTRAILFEPHELIEKLAALIPKPRINLLLYHGVLGPNARLRSAAVARAKAACSPEAAGSASHPEATPTPGSSAGRHGPVPPPPNDGPGAGIRHRSAGSSPPNDPGGPPVRTRAKPRPHATWAELLRRTFEIDVLACPECGGRLRLLATIEDPAVARKILAHMGVPTECPQPQPARPPPWARAASPELFDFDTD